MAEELSIPATTDKTEIYEALLPQINALTEGEDDLVANLANVAAALRSGLNFFWVGFYIVKDNQLILGPFQGPVACTRIPFGKGVCGACYTQRKTIIVPDVDQFPGHIACSSLSKSEIVVPGIKNAKMIFVLDVDSERLDNFDNIDKKYLEEVVKLVLK